MVNGKKNLPKWIDLIIWILIAVIAIYAIIAKSDGRIFFIVTILMLISAIIKFIWAGKDKR